MEFIKLIRYEHPFTGYHYKDASNLEMNILGNFLASDVYRPSSYIEWIFDDKSQYASGNLTHLQKYKNYVLMKDQFSEEDVPTILKMTREQFIQILTDWEEKVLKLKPKEVTITYNNNEFVIETKN